MKEYYEGLRARGKEGKVAIIAVVRKIVITLNSMSSNNTDWVAA